MILVVSHDAGGAEVVSSWARRQNSELCYCLEGPAKKVFARKLDNPDIRPPSELGTLVNNAEWVITGSSWASNLEKQTVRLARSSNTHCVTFLEHWTNYPERFLLNDEQCLPNEIWTGDKDAYALACSVFPKDIVRIKTNPYFEDIKQEIRQFPTPPSHSLRILYVCEPIAYHEETDDIPPCNYDEFQAADYFRSVVGNLDNLELVRLRLHPSEPEGKFEKYSENLQGLPLEKSDGTTLVEDCSWANCVVGCESMALVVGLLAEKRVYSSIPPGGRACALPQREIKPISELIA